jgi:hypothetical protein
MQISHAETHKLIQYSMDCQLPQEDEKTLASHLQTCLECNRYNAEIKDAESTLRSTMNKHWNLTPPPLYINSIRGEKVEFSPYGRLGMQLAAISLMVMLVVFGTWRFVGGDVTPTTTIQISPIPTPSAQMTSTHTLNQNCGEIVYTVQQGETLESIAELFSTSPESIMKLNKPASGTLQAGNKIKILTCFTPSATIRPVTFTVTFSPAPLKVSTP